MHAVHRNRFLADWLAPGAAAAAAVVLVIWVMPWIPIGMTLDDYTSAEWIGLVLWMATALLGFLALRTKQQGSGGAAVIEMLQSLLGRRPRIRNRRQFYRRLARECRRSHRDRRLALSLVLIRLSRGNDSDEQGNPRALEPIVQILATKVRSNDIVGTISDSEVGVLAIGADDQGLEVICARFKRSLASAFPEWTGGVGSDKVPALSLGASTLSPDNDDPDTLIAVARKALTPIGRELSEAA